MFKRRATLGSSPEKVGYASTVSVMERVITSLASSSLQRRHSLDSPLRWTADCEAIGSLLPSSSQHAIDAHHRNPCRRVRLTSMVAKGLMEWGRVTYAQKQGSRDLLATLATVLPESGRVEFLGRPLRRGQRRRPLTASWRREVRNGQTAA